MKTMTLALLVLTLFPHPLFAAPVATENSWTCTGANLEGLSIGKDKNGRLAGGMSWDCWPGGGICSQGDYVQLIADRDGNLVYRGSHFNLVIFNTDTVGENGNYPGKISATDERDPKSRGQGFTISEAVSCARGN
jgi:hypothetical protein